MQPAPMPDRAFFLRQLSVRHIVIAYENVVDAVFVDSWLQFFHAGTSSCLAFFLWYSSLRLARVASYRRMASGSPASASAFIFHSI